MTRFQVVGDYLLKIPIYTTSLKFYDFVCVFICVFKNFYASKFLNWTKKNEISFYLWLKPSNKTNGEELLKNLWGKKAIFSKSKWLFVWKILEGKKEKDQIITQHCCLQHQHCCLQHHRCPPKSSNIPKHTYPARFVPQKN